MGARTDDDARLSALYGLEILDSGPDPAFDDMADLAAQLCDTPVALVSLVGIDRQWFKARINFPLCETDLSRSVCRFVVDAADVIVVPDLTIDARTRDNPLVLGEPGIRFYAGAPLATDDGHVLGSLCVIDVVPRPGGLTDAQITALTAISRRVVDAIEMRRLIRERDIAVRAHDDAAGRQRALLEIGDTLRDCTSVADMTRSTARIVGRTVGASRAGYGVVDHDVETIEIEPDWTIEGVPSIAGRHRFDDYGDLRTVLLAGDSLVVADVENDPRTVRDPKALRDVAVGAMINMPVREQGRIVGLFIVHTTEPREWSDAEVAFVRNVADRLEVGIARLRAEQQQAMLNGEIAHRLKNSLSMVQAIANQTLRNSADPDRLNAFQQRVRALGTAHDALLRRDVRSATLHDVVEQVLLAAGIGGRYIADGPPVLLGARATLSTSLLLHELATNALKYGALSARGSVEVRWREDAVADGLELEWTERGGPAATPPTRKGFGSRLLSLGLVGTGGSTLRYDHEGFGATFRASMEHLQSA